MASSPQGAGLIIFVVMSLFTFWFGSLMLKAVDILYKPSVKNWIKNRPIWQKPPDGFCSAGELAENDCFNADSVLNISPDDEYLAKLEMELAVLKAMKGFTGPDPKGKFRKAPRINFWLNTDTTCFTSFSQLILSYAEMCSLQQPKVN